MTHILNWLVSKNYRVILSAVVFSPIFPIITSSILVLDTIVNDLRTGIRSAFISSIIVIFLLIFTGTDSIASIFLSILPLYSGLFLGYLMIKSRSVTFVFQSTYLFCFFAIIVGLFFDNFSLFFGQIFDQLVEIFASASVSDSQILSLNSWRDLFFSLIVSIVFVQLIMSFFIGIWSLSVIKKDRSYFIQFRSLRLGRFLGIPATLLLFLSIFVDILYIDSFFSLVLVGFCIQGLAVIHDYAATINLHPMILTLLYILLVTPLTGFVILIISLVGLLDNWINIRSIYRH